MNILHILVFRALCAFELSYLWYFLSELGTFKKPNEAHLVDEIIGFQEGSVIRYWHQSLTIFLLYDLYVFIQLKMNFLLLKFCIFVVWVDIVELKH